MLIDFPWAWKDIPTRAISKNRESENDNDENEKEEDVTEGNILVEIDRGLFMLFSFPSRSFWRVSFSVIDTYRSLIMTKAESVPDPQKG